MSKVSSIFICQQCNYHSPAFLGRCPECGTWNSLVEEQISVETIKQSKEFSKLPKIVNLSDIEKRDYDRLSSGILEFDRVLGGGIVLGSLVLLSGEPGIGKSTLLSQLSVNLNKTLYIAGEESARQIKLRINRIKKNAHLSVLNEVDIDMIEAVIKDNKPSLVIIDSIQTMETGDLSSPPGSVGQVRECAHRLHRLSKDLHIPIFIVGHITKDGSVAGPKTLEHLVDVVLYLEGELNSQFRVLRANKNRFGTNDEVGMFEMEDSGMKEIKNPSELFLEGKVNAPGSTVVAVVSGMRPILVEIQALVTKSFLPVPKRVGSGVDNNRLQLLVAVLQKRLNLPLFNMDIFVNVTGGLRVTEPAADLGIALSIISSLKDQIIFPKTVVIGEIGLLGELRAVRNLAKRIKEAKNLGYRNIVSPDNAKDLNQAIKLTLEYHGKM